MAIGTCGGRGGRGRLMDEDIKYAVFRIKCSSTRERKHMVESGHMDPSVLRSVTAQQAS